MKTGTPGPKLVAGKDDGARRSERDNKAGQPDRDTFGYLDAVAMAKRSRMKVACTLNGYKISRQ
jgi:hypothetical protein